MRTFLIACIIVAIKTSIAAAAVTPFTTPPDQATADRANAIALARWGGTPACAGQVTQQWASLPTGVNAVSTWWTPPGGTLADYQQCVITYNRDAYWDWPKYCTIVEHEFGHLTGHAHVDDQNDVMTPYYVIPTPECDDGAPPPPVISPAAQDGGSMISALNISVWTTPTRRYQAIRLVMRMLPKPKTWKVACTPMTVRHPTCRATRSGSHPRRYRVIIRKGKVVDVQAMTLMWVVSQ